MAIHGWTVAPAGVRRATWAVVVDAVRQGGRAGGFRLDEGRTAGINVSIFVWHSAEKPEVDGDINRRRKRRRECQTQRPKEVDKEEVKKQEEMEGKIEGRKKKKDKNSYVKDLAPWECSLRAGDYTSFASQYLLFYNKVISIRAWQGYIKVPRQTINKSSKGSISFHFNTFLLEKHCQYLNQLSRF